MLHCFPVPPGGPGGPIQKGILAAVVDDSARIQNSASATGSWQIMNSGPLLLLATFTLSTYIDTIGPSLPSLCLNLRTSGSVTAAKAASLSLQLLRLRLSPRCLSGRFWLLIVSCPLRSEERQCCIVFLFPIYHWLVW
jgi:hypothetical protein